jgi:3-hydroxybutyryl-CoA dehydratase
MPSDMHKRTEVDGGYVFEDLAVGMEASYTRAVTEADLHAFAAVTGDSNPIHLDVAYAARTPFKERIAHGMLSAGYISAVLGTRLPGPGAVYVSQTLSFRGPVKIGDTVTAHVKLRELVAGKRRAVFDCRCSIADKSVLEGEAVLMVPARTKV